MSARTTEWRPNLLDLYTLASDLIRFRYLVEFEYVSEHLNPLDAPPPPEVVARCAATITHVVERMIQSGGDSEALALVRNAASDMTHRFLDAWMNAEHRDRLEVRYQLGRFREPDLPAWDLDWLTLTAPLAPAPSPAALSGPPVAAQPSAQSGASSSDLDGISALPGAPFAPDAWEPFAAAVRRLADAVPAQDRPVFRLGQELARVRYPLPSG